MWGYFWPERATLFGFSATVCFFEAYIFWASLMDIWTPPFKGVTTGSDMSTTKTNITLFSPLGALVVVTV